MGKDDSIHPENYSLWPSRRLARAIVARASLIPLTDAALKPRLGTQQHSHIGIVDSGIALPVAWQA